MSKGQPNEVFSVRNLASNEPPVVHMLLTQNQVTILDWDDYMRPEVREVRWCANFDKRVETYYVHGNSGNQLHRVILGTPKGKHTDHINRNGLDNRRNNLRVAANWQNQCNVGLRRDNTSGFKGIYQEKRSGKWRCGINHRGKKISFGFFDTPEEAARAWDAKAIELRGPFAVLNFPTAANEDIERTE